MAKQIKHIYGSTALTDYNNNGAWNTYSYTIYTVPSGRIAKLMIDYIYNGYANTSYTSYQYYSNNSKIALCPGLYDVQSTYYQSASTNIQATLYEGASGASGSVYQAYAYPNNAWKRPIEHAIILSAGQTVSVEQAIQSGQTTYAKWNMLIVEEY